MALSVAQRDARKEFRSAEPPAVPRVCILCIPSFTELLHGPDPAKSAPSESQESRKWAETMQEGIRKRAGMSKEWVLTGCVRRKP